MGFLSSPLEMALVIVNEDFLRGLVRVLGRVLCVMSEGFERSIFLYSASVSFWFDIDGNYG